jgi:NADPH:quinone reductase-like Zn-dependent oxidoreductase
MPILQPGDALVRVLASGTTRNELDWGPTYTDEKGNSRTPAIPGHELCGIVEKVAPDVKDVAPGDAVYALTSFFRDGTAAEYIAVSAADLAPKPKTIDAIQAASVPLSGLTAWQALVTHAQLKKGQRILIHGGAGGVGIFAIQIARHLGAYIITISGESLEQPAPNLGVRGIFFIVKANREQLIILGDLIDKGVIKTDVSTILPLEQAKKAFEMAFTAGKHGKIVLQVGNA